LGRKKQGLGTEAPQQWRLGFELDDRTDEEALTAYAGTPVLVEMFRASGAAGVVDEHSPKVRERGLSASQLLESLLVLWAAGGERCEQLSLLRQDRALCQLLGYELPAPQTARDFFERFHQEDLPLVQAGQFAFVREESKPLHGLARANQRLVEWQQSMRTQRKATLDVDATIIASDKQAALPVYEGGRGYQPVVVLWAEQDLIVHDEFRDGNVPAGSGNARILQGALAALPKGVEEIYLRADSALYEQSVLRLCQDKKIGYAISADLSKELKQAILAIPEDSWQLDRDEGDALKQWAEVDFTPDDRTHRKNSVAPRYLAIRILKKQGALFGDGNDRKHFAVVTNREGPGLEILRWHRGKAGSVEHVHDILKNDLAAAALPSQKFGANAAWFRANVLLANLFVAMRAPLPEDFARARPKRLRFELLNTVGRVIVHARQTLLRLVLASARHCLDLIRTAAGASLRSLPGD
jgi:hypothetical protein